jgi:4-amino-4-deoxy-L-arabinose transferase-like glycosyltransferase
MSQSLKAWLFALSWVGAALRMRALFANSFHSDEALFASWARQIAVWKDPLLLNQAIDKPPFLFYLQAASYPLFGAEEWSARQPAYIASICLVPLVGAISWQQTRSAVAALVAASCVALSPLAIQYGATAFLDPPLTFFVMGAILFLWRDEPAKPASRLRRRNAMLSGLFFGFAIAAKLQAVLFGPLIIGMALADRRPSFWWRSWFAGLLPILLLLFAWELARHNGTVSWALQVANFGGVRPIWSWELWSRLGDWLRLWRYTVATPAFLFLIALLAWMLAASLLRRRGAQPPGRAQRGTRPIAGAALRGDDPRLANPQFRRIEGNGAKLTTLFLVSYGLFHWLAAIPVWDRYLLPAVPLVALIAGYAFRGLATKLGARTLRLIAATFLILQLPWALRAMDGRHPIGGEASADHGASAVGLELADSPYGTVLYDHWYSWQWRYHLFASRVFVSWFAHPANLVEDLNAFADDGNPRFLVLPKSSSARPVQRAVLEAGFQLTEVANEAEWQMILYRVTPARSSS